MVVIKNLQLSITRRN